MKKTLLVALTLLAALALTLNVYAQSEMSQSLLGSLDRSNIASFSKEDASLFPATFLTAINSTNEADYAYLPTKAGDGIINATTFWVDVPKRINEVSQEENALTGYTWGLTQGLALGFMRGASGVYDITTFAIPPYTQHSMKAEYKVDHTHDRLKVPLLSW